MPLCCTAFAAQSLLAALGSLQLVCNVFFAYFVNHEAVTKLIILSTCCIIGGCVLLVVFGNQSSETYTVDQLIHFYTLPAYVVYLVMMAVFVFGFYVLYLHSKKVCRKRGECGFWYGLLLVSYAIFSALLGSQSVLFGKSISVILRTTFTESNQLGNWYTWVVLPLFTFTALFWVTRLNKGLRMFPAMIIVPLLQIAWTLFSIVSGMLYFQEYKGFTTLKAIMFPVGVLIVFIGVFILTSGGRAPPEEETEEEVGEPAEDGQRPPKVSMYDNAMYSVRSDMDGHPGDTPYGPPTQSKMSLGQTLRFTSTWAPPSVAVSPASNLNRTLVPSDTLRRQLRLTAPSDLNATDNTNRTDALTPTASVAGEQHHHPDGGGGEGQGGWGNRTYDRNSTLNRTAQSTMSRISETSMVSTMRKGLKSVGSALTSDIGFNMNGLKLAVGLGDSHLSGVSLFTMPALDFTATTRRKTERSEGRTSRTGTRNTEMSILSALPRSRFYKGDPDHLTVIREASGVPPTTVPHSPDSNQLPGSSPDSNNAHASAAAAIGRAGSTTSAQTPDVGRGTSASQPRQQHPPALSAGVAPDKPLTEAAMMNLLPVPSFQDARSTPLGTPPADSGEQQQQQVPLSASASEAPKGAPPGGIGSGGSQPGSAQRAQRSRRPSALPESGRRTPPLGPAGLGGLARAASGLHPGYDSDVNTSARASPPLQQYRSGGGGDAPDGAASYDGPAAAVAVGSGALRAARASLPKPGSFGAILPEGVPLSTANSVVIHESGAATPPEGVVRVGGIGMGAGIGAGLGQQQQQQLPRQHGGELWAAGSINEGGGIVQQPRPQSQSQPRTQSQSAWRHSSASRLPQTQQDSLQLQQASLLQQQFQQQQQQPLSQQQSVQSLHQQQQPPQQIPLSVLHRAAAPPAGTVRLPALHLMIPGLPISPPQQQTALAAPHTGGMGASYMQYGTSSLSYAQMLAGQGVFTEPGARVLQQTGPVGGSLSLGGAGSAGVGLAAVRVHGRAQAANGPLSVSRSWAGLSPWGAVVVGTAAPRKSPLRGALVQQMQRPLQPWQQH
ncbi:hypothetical protein Vretimale_17472 [Volvox reticuliferus]|uniref:Magnesium transporter n=1 Tax=Volvox reticuliferus TaxID=1737510 RepID=A0A8J4GWA8_9CHLO|nr:hypothetical protein Vretifemale_20789 [Volvox reticuliferus]GIM14546.1 hypothetical protein Vretimale_17472 [Volvox reticuliferus]